jgi:hypothetical protein
MSTQQNDSSPAQATAAGARPHGPNEAVEIGIRLLDDAYTAWFTAEAECEQALRAWSEGTNRNRDHGYFAYCAALDREEAAARDLEKLWALAGACHDHLVALAQDAAG